MALASDSRLIAEIYSYFIRGRQLIVIENLDVAPTDDEAPMYKAPGDTHTASLMLEYTSVPDTSAMVDESDDLPVDEIIAKAIVDYIKAELAEEPAMKEYYLDRFNKRIVRYTEGRVGGHKRLILNGTQHIR